MESFAEAHFECASLNIVLKLNFFKKIKNLAVFFFFKFFGVNADASIVHKVY